MLRKFFIGAALVASCIGASAQVDIIAGSKTLTLPQAIDLPAGVSMASSPAKLASLDGTDLWGYYAGNTVEGLNIIGAQTAATYSVAYFVPSSGVLQGAKIHGVSVPFITTGNMNNISAWISTDLNDRVASKGMFLSDLVSYDYNKIVFNEPYQIPAEGIYVGVTFTISRISEQYDGYPLAFYADTSFKKSFLCKRNDGAWEDWSSEYGCYAMKLYVSNLNLPQAELSVTAPSDLAVKANSRSTISVPVTNKSSQAVSSIDYTIDIEGNVQTGHTDLARPVPAGLSRSGVVEVSFDAPANIGSHIIKLTIDKMNGVENISTSKSFTSSIKTVKDVARHCTVVEEFTGTGCGFCSRGWLGMEKLKETRADFIGIAVHQYSSSDPMYVASYCPFSTIFNTSKYGAPGCAIDRKSGLVDPYYGENNENYGIVDAFDEYNRVVPLVGVHVRGVYNADSTYVDAKCTVDYLYNDAGNYTVAYVLTADSLSGTTSSWGQSNYYAYAAGYTTPDGSPIDILRPGGEYGSSKIYVTFNDVMISSSYSATGLNRAPSLTNSGDTGTSSYSVPMPTKTTLKNAINYGLVDIVALVINNSTGKIENATKTRVMSPEEYAGITTTKTGSSAAHEVARFNAAGQPIAAPQKGMNIVKYSDGRTVKVVVK